MPERQFISLAAVTALIGQGIPVYVTEQLLHLLSQKRALHVARILLPDVRVLNPGRYLRRWARRLRDAGISREDALIVSHASFGIDLHARTLGAEAILSTDYALKEHQELSQTTQGAE